MIEKIVVPVLGESITEATVSKWLKKEGDNVEVDEPLVELETDKVNLEVPSPISGVLTEISSKNGSVVEVGALLGSVSEDVSVSPKDDVIEKIKTTKKKENVIVLEEKIKEPKIDEEKPQEQPLVLTDEVKEEDEIEKQIEQETLSPAVRKIVAENNIDI